MSASTTTNAVILHPDGKFLRGGFFPARGKASVSWADEYPDAATYTLTDAASVAVRLKDAGIRVNIVTDYGSVAETFYAG